MILSFGDEEEEAGETQAEMESNSDKDSDSDLEQDSDGEDVLFPVGNHLSNCCPASFPVASTVISKQYLTYVKYCITHFLSSSGFHMTSSLSSR